MLFGLSGFSQDKEISKKLEWNGYTQLRAYDNFGGSRGFQVRRMKLWFKSTPAFSRHWSYKVQATISSLNQEKFFLQDAKVSYDAGLFSFDFGQFVPAYSLQRSQPDWTIPAIERAKVINAITPNGSLGVRDIGLQANFQTKNKSIETHFGAFNGYGIKEFRYNHSGYLLTHKTAINIPLRENKLKFGYSLMFRKAENMKIKKVFPDTLAYTGKDLRYNIFALFNSKFIDLQAELLNAAFDHSKASGYYLLSTINIKKSQIVLAFEDYKNTYSGNNKPYYRLGYNYLINKNKIKLFADNYFQIINGSLTNYMASIQLQIFFK